MGPGRYPGVLGRHGKEVIELSVAHAQKADAVRSLRQRFDASTVLFVGDDLTDESVFADLSGQDVGIKVGSGESAALWRKHRAWPCVAPPGAGAFDVQPLAAFTASLRVRCSHPHGVTRPI